MIISATDFQLRVNEYFMKMIQGEEVIIERYGKKFAVLLPFEKYEKNSKVIASSEKSGEFERDLIETEKPAESSIKTVTSGEDSGIEKAAASTSLSPAELTKLLKMLLAKIS